MKKKFSRMILVLGMILTLLCACAANSSKETFDNLVGTPTDYSKAES